MYRCTSNPIIMGNLDEKYLAGKDSSYSFGKGIQGSQYLANKERRSAALALIDAGVGSITSRDQIINPYDLIDPSMYTQTRRGKSQYESDLAALTAFQQLQEAAYQEWYDSPEQAAIREREAGINPDFVGLDNAGDASAVEPSGMVPGANLPSNGEVASNVVGHLISTVGALSSVASLATAFTNIPIAQQVARDTHNLSSAQLEALQLSNRGELARQMSGDIASLLGTAVQSHLDSGSQEAFDYDAWFAEDKNFESLASAYGHYGGYAAALSLARDQSLKYHKDSVDLQRQTAQGEFDFGSIISDPRLSPSQKLTSVQLRPYVEATIKSRLALDKLSAAVAEFDTKVREGMDVQSAVDAANSKFRTDVAVNEYNASYYDTLQADVMAEFENYLREVDTIGLTLRKSINTGYLDMYNNDPSGLDGYKAAYLFGNNGGASWQEAYQMQNISQFVEFYELNKDLLQSQLTNEKWSRWLELADIVSRSFSGGNLKGAAAAFSMLRKLAIK